jgi:hypothetical protein
MRFKRLSGVNLAITEAADLIEDKYKAEPVDLEKLTPVGPWKVEKADQPQKTVAAPYSMAKLLNLLDSDEYHCGCVDAVVMATITQFVVNNAQVKMWLEAAEFPGTEDAATIVSELVKYYLACGNGFLVKMRNAKGEWVGCERLLPSEAQIIERFDEFGFFRPDFIQVKNGQRRYFRNTDIIHFKKGTHKSTAWGLACLPVAMNIEILSEIKTFDYNNFRNGLLIDYFVIVEGGSLRDGTVTDNDGNTAITDAYAEIEKVLAETKGNPKSHSTVLIESENKDVHIRLEPLRQEAKDGGFLALKKDLREGIFAYHRVPARVVSQLIPGQLGGDNRSDMLMFYHFVVKPLQRRIALVLAKEFNREFAWGVKPEEFDFGDITTLFQSDDEKLFQSNKIN